MELQTSFTPSSSLYKTYELYTTTSFTDALLLSKVSSLLTSVHIMMKTMIGLLQETRRTTAFRVDRVNLLSGMFDILNKKRKKHLFQMFQLYFIAILFRRTLFSGSPFAAVKRYPCQHLIDTK